MLCGYPVCGKHRNKSGGLFDTPKYQCTPFCRPAGDKMQSTVQSATTRAAYGDVTGDPMPCLPLHSHQNHDYVTISVGDRPVVHVRPDTGLVQALLATSYPEIATSAKVGVVVEYDVPSERRKERVVIVGVAGFGSQLLSLIGMVRIPGVAKLGSVGPNHEGKGVVIPQSSGSITLVPIGRCFHCQAVLPMDEKQRHMQKYHFDVVQRRSEGTPGVRSGTNNTDEAVGAWGQSSFQTDTKPSSDLSDPLPLPPLPEVNSDGVIELFYEPESRDLRVVPMDVYLMDWMRMHAKGGDQPELKCGSAVEFSDYGARPQRGVLVGATVDAAGKATNIVVLLRDAVLTKGRPYIMPSSAAASIQRLKLGRCKHCSEVFPMDEFAAHKQMRHGGTSSAQTQFGDSHLAAENPTPSSVPDIHTPTQGRPSRPNTTCLGEPLPVPPAPDD